MKAYRLKANKTNMVKLLQAKKYKPSIRKAHFYKGPDRRHRAYWLNWIQDNLLHTALLTTAAGKAFIKISFGDDRHPKFILLSLAELNLYNLCEEVL